MFEKVTESVLTHSVAQCPKILNEPCAESDLPVQATGGGKNQPWEKRRVDSFPVASQVINELMASLLANIKDQRILRQKLFQANFHSTLAGESMASLLSSSNVLHPFLAV